MRTVAIVQARVGSTRLPGKVLLPLAGKPMLAHVVERTERADRLDEVVVATTVSVRDEAIVDACRSRGWPVERGSEDDVLDRYYEVAQKHHAGTIVRITSDCPLTDPTIIDRAVTMFSQGGFDYVSNTLDPRTFPRGLDVEVFSFRALERAWNEDRDPAWRDHVTPYIHRHPERFRLGRLAHDRDLSGYRWTVDTQEDFELVRRIFEHFRTNTFSWTEVLQLLATHPDWNAINRGVKQKVVR